MPRSGPVSGRWIATAHDAALVSLVDLPDVDSRVVSRVLAAAVGPGVLARASYDGVPGHPVLLGSDHWADVIEAATGDRGARDFLAAREVSAGRVRRPRVGRRRRCPARPQRLTNVPVVA